MKARLVLVMALALPGLAMAQAAPSSSSSVAGTGKSHPEAAAHLDRHKLSYAVGYQIGTRIAARKS
ncbi:MAG: hypothetical protein PF446_05410, partial [Oleiagrimonas sp.]|nr:hypothetical protein [Oleiagrimonas sp.]